MSNQLQEAAKKYFEKDIAIVAVNQKKPLTEWAQWQARRQTSEEFENQPWSNADGFAILCGIKTSNGLYIATVDFDVKNVTEEAQTNGKQILKQLLTTQMEKTPSGGQHWIYQTHNKPKTMNACHSECGLELLGEGKLCIMAPSQGYSRFNDNQPAIIVDLETELCQAMYHAGFKPRVAKCETDSWFDRKDLNGKRFNGKTPPCVEALYKGAKEGQRNENAIRLASFLANFRKIRPDHVLEQMHKNNKLNDPPLDDQEMQGIIKSAVNGGYVYGCQDPILKTNCNRDECPIAPANIAKMLTKEETEQAEKLHSEYNLLDYALTFGKQRLIGEDKALLTNFVMFCSGHTQYPISGVISGFSGSGKNESVRAVKPLLPKEWYFEFTTSTPEAIKYLPEDFDGTLLIYEALGVKGDSGSLSLRAIGEGESIETIYPMRNDVTGKMELGRSKTNAKNFISTSSDIDINPDLFRRVLKHTMNHSTLLTKRVMAKRLRDAAYPESLKVSLGMRREFPFGPEDFQNALRLLNWKLEVVVFAPPELLRILDLATKREQEVALRTHLEKILHFTRVLALINQRKRMHVKIGELELVIANAEDLLQAIRILQDTIVETVSRIEKRQEEALELFSSEDVLLTKHDVASKLKISTRTAAKALKTLASAGYLREETLNRGYQYRLLQKKPNHLALLQNASQIRLFHQNSLREWLNVILPSYQAKRQCGRDGDRYLGELQIFNPGKGVWETPADHAKEWVNSISATKDSSSENAKPNATSQMRDGKMPSETNCSLVCGKEGNHLAESQRASQFSPEYSDSNSSADWTLDGLATEAKSIIRVTDETETETCVVCGLKVRPDWLVTLFDGSWGFLCGSCGAELSSRLSNREL